MDVSIVIPVYNEEQNVQLVYNRNKEVLDQLNLKYEVIFIDDSSKDKTIQKLSEIKDKNLRVIEFRNNQGQTAAMDAGFKAAKGKIIISMDGDLQNDPEDIPRLIEKMKQGYDVVCGWRKHRKDTITKHISSRFANVMRKMILHDRIHDSGCSLKAYKKECFEDVDLYGEMHRFIPAILRWKGFKITEIVVRHHPRKYGKTKYNFKRLIKGFLDMIVVKFWMQYSTRPIHLFGGLGILMGGLGVLIGFYLLYVKFVLSQGIGNRPLLMLAVLLMVLGTQFIGFGVLADILIKIYYTNKRNYSIKKEWKN